MSTDPNNDASSEQEATNLMTCVECGFRLESPTNWMWLRCPSCGTLGYPDRARQHLLSLDWNCLSCGAHNSGLVNFCTNCGTGLASRCLRCEAPIYTAVCPHCGSHQERLLRLQRVEEQRATWTPILLTQLEESRQPLAPDIGGCSLIRSERRQLRKFAHQWSNLARIPGWGLIWVIVGLLMLAWQFRGGLVYEISNISPQIQVSQLAQLRDSAAAWWSSFLFTLDNLSTDSQEYSYLFASAVFGLAVIPILLYFLHRILRRLFP